MQLNNAPDSETQLPVLSDETILDEMVALNITDAADDQTVNLDQPIDEQPLPNTVVDGDIADDLALATVQPDQPLQCQFSQNDTRIKLDIAKAYLALHIKKRAKKILEEVLQFGSTRQQREHAKVLLEGISEH